ncbi:MAG: BatA and WFA domain-containing protein [Verrucomicrobiota bacterium]
MNFAAPIALLFLALFVPVILLYLLKQRRRRMEVSTLMFWDKILRDEQTVTSISKLKKLLSLLLQLLFIALLTFAIARPLLSGKLTGARRIVLLLDTSASMWVKEGNKTRFDLARQKARGVIRGMSIGDSLMLVSVAAQPDLIQPFTDNKKDLEEALEKLQPTHGETDFKKALTIVEQLPSDERETHVYIVSDGAFDPVEINPPPKTRFAFLEIGKETDNIGITAFQVRPLPFSARDFQVHVEISNQTGKSQKVPLELKIGGRLVDAYEFEVASGKSVSRTLRQFSAEGGEIEAVLDVKDAFPLDDHAYAMLPKPKPLRVQLVTKENLFLQRALATDDEVELEVVDPTKYSATNRFDVTIFSGWIPPTTPERNSIFVGDWPADLGLVKSGEITKPLFTEWQREHPVNRHLSLQNVGMDRAIGVEANVNFQKLASSFSDPLILLREDGAQKVLVLLFDTATTDLPLRVAFPILMANAIRYLSGAETTERWANPPMNSILGANELSKYAGTNLQAAIDPDGNRFSVSAGQTLISVNKAGFYEGETITGEKLPLFAASLVSSSESRIAPVKKLPLRSKQPVVELKESFRVGFEPWFFLAFLALILSTVEWGLFHRRVIE